MCPSSVDLLTSEQKTGNERKELQLALFGTQFMTHYMHKTCTGNPPSPLKRIAVPSTPPVVRTGIDASNA